MLDLTELNQNIPYGNSLGLFYNEDNQTVYLAIVTVQKPKAHDRIVSGDKVLAAIKIPADDIMSLITTLSNIIPGVEIHKTSYKIN